MHKHPPRLPAQHEIAKQRLCVEGQERMIEVEEGKRAGGHAFT
jgi:hypothetical protein